MHILILAFCIAIPAWGQDAFIGTWETHKVSRSARAAITVVVRQKTNTHTGNVYLANRDGSSRELTFDRSSQDGDTLKFTTPMDQELFYWSLTLRKGGKSGVLKGSYHEMLIEEKVTRQRLTNLHITH